jgi:hypothetical protein
MPNRDSTQGGHEDKSFKKELTEETEANPKRFLAGFKSFTLLPPFPPVQSFCVSVLPPSQGLRRANSLTFASRDCMGAKPDPAQSRHLSERKLVFDGLQSLCNAAIACKRNHRMI